MSDVFSLTKETELKWAQRAEQQEEVIRKVNTFDQENSWNFLIKPYHQQQTLLLLIESAKKSQSTISNFIFKNQIWSRISWPPQLKTMLDICKLRDHTLQKMQDP